MRLRLPNIIKGSRRTCHSQYCDTANYSVPPSTTHGNKAPPCPTAHNCPPVKVPVRKVPTPKAPLKLAGNTSIVRLTAGCGGVDPHRTACICEQSSGRLGADTICAHHRYGSTTLKSPVRHPALEGMQVLRNPRGTASISCNVPICLPSMIGSILMTVAVGGRCATFTFRGDSGAALSA